MATNPILILQILTGLGMLAHGLPKLKNLNQTARDFKKMGYGKGIGVAAAIIESIGALLLILAIFPRVMAALMGLTMLASMAHHWQKKQSFKDGWETSYLYFVAAVVIVLSGYSPWGLII